VIGGRRRLALTGAVAVLALLASSCALPARSTYAYRGKAIATTTRALAAVQTAVLTAEMATRGRTTAAYTSVTLADAESEGTGAQSSFDSIQPPDSRSDSLRDELDAILSDIVDTLSSMRITARRGELDRLAPLTADGRKEIARLQAFRVKHR
jgi:hypothetical protein